jgi:hypothetical protein
MNLAARVTELLQNVRFPGYVFLVDEGHGGTFLQGTYYDADVHTGFIARQTTRKWPMSPHMTDSEVVQTAFKCVLTSREHDTRERFTYKWQRIFSPHFDVEDLVRLCEAGKSDAGGRK